MQIPEKLVAFLEGPAWCFAGTRDRENLPASHAVFGVEVADDRAHLTVMIAEHWSERLRENIADNGRLVLVGTQQMTHETYQIKGTGAEVRAATEADFAVQERWRAAFLEALKSAGSPETYDEAIRAIRVRPCVAVTMKIDEVFVQTPGPGAGDRIAS